MPLLMSVEKHLQNMSCMSWTIKSYQVYSFVYILSLTGKLIFSLNNYCIHLKTKLYRWQFLTPHKSWQFPSLKANKFAVQNPENFAIYIPMPLYQTKLWQTIRVNYILESQWKKISCKGTTTFVILGG